jgi:hypothetical protein
MAIEGFNIQHADATVVFGNQILQTPHITSISVRRVRGELVGKARFTYFTAQSDGENSSSDVPVIISWYGTPIFAGYAKRVQVGPSFRCANEVVVSVEAEDVLHKLVNKRINRRQKLDGLGPLAFITSIHKRPFVGYDNPQDIYNITGGQSPPIIYDSDPQRINARFSSNSTNTVGDQHPIMKASDTILNRAGTGGGAGGTFFLHDHSSLDTTGPHAGGPSVAVYGIK